MKEKEKTTTRLEMWRLEFDLQRSVGTEAAETYTVGPNYESSYEKIGEQLFETNFPSI